MPDIRTRYVCQIEMEIETSDINGCRYRVYIDY